MTTCAASSLGQGAQRKHARTSGAACSNRISKFRWANWALESRQKPLPREQPSVTRCREAVARVPARPIFLSSPKRVSLLRFAADAALSSRSQRIKGYTIAIEALGRSSDLDPHADTIIRVEAGRVRQVLRSYYAACGCDDPIVMALPVGSCVPTFISSDFTPPICNEATTCRNHTRRI